MQKMYIIVQICNHENDNMKASPTAIFRALAAPQRLAIFRQLLHATQPLCSSALAAVFELPLYAMSRHLKMLQAAGLVTERRDGRHVYYTARRHNSAFMQHVCSAVHELAPASSPDLDPAPNQNLVAPALEVAHA
jgi:ArsR family transcriptional regulator, arsenate/arsenite/antimonite-responsive transcriptional repressor